MKILHTSDWHLGHSLFNRKRTNEQQAFLLWLKETIKAKKIDALLVSGDVFDSSIPGNQAQELYYHFLGTLASDTACRRVIIVAGNHDSASFIEAPKAVLQSLKVNVIGRARQNIQEEVIEINDSFGQQLLVCAVPYLRDKDLCISRQGETSQERESRILKAIRDHYRQVLDDAIKRKKHQKVPIVAMGHLYVSGSITKERLLGQADPLYVGSLGQVPIDIFPKDFHYVALGHIHLAQKVGEDDRIQYSGSPLPLNFSEVNNQRRVVLVEFSEKGERKIEYIDVPLFQELVQIKGNWEHIEQQIIRLKQKKSQAWVEVVYESSVVMGDLRARVLKLIESSSLEVLRIKNTQVIKEALSHRTTPKDLQQLTPMDVFEFCLQDRQVDNDQRPLLREYYLKALRELQSSED